MIGYICIIKAVVHGVIHLQISWKEVREHSDGLDLHDTLDMSQIQRENRAVIRILPVSVLVHAFESSGVMHVTGEASADVVYRCSRCLQDFDSRLQAELDERFVTRETTEKEEEEDFRTVSGHLIDMDPVVYESMVLAMPYRPLCKEDCAGLCPSCGVNRNEAACSCDTTPIDPRLANLKDFFSDTKPD